MQVILPCNGWRFFPGLNLDLVLVRIHMKNNIEISFELGPCISDFNVPHT